MKALEQEKEEKMTLSEEEREKADAEIKELVIKRTELFNYKQTLDTSKEKDESQRDIRGDFQTGWRD
mgnify:CR=1 FL=1